MGRRRGWRMLQADIGTAGKIGWYLNRGIMSEEDDKEQVKIYRIRRKRYLDEVLWAV